MNLENVEILPVEIENINVKFKNNNINIYLKRIIDIFASIIGIILLIPLIVYIYIINLIKKENKKIFFVQERIGKNGKLFKMYKFQTMIDNADEELELYLERNEEAQKEYKINKKLKNDPRITKIGKTLRKTSLDEFPQFINVLKGDMSLVGPRPYLPKEKKDMGKYYDNIVASKPGITGPWQIAGRSNTTFEDRLKIEYEYSLNQCFITQDMTIVFKTIVPTFKGHGAV